MKRNGNVIHKSCISMNIFNFADINMCVHTQGELKISLAHLNITKTLR